MEPWTGAQGAFAVKAFYKNGDSFVIAQSEFRREFGIHRNRAVPSAHANRTWVRNFEAIGSTLKKKGGSVNPSNVGFRQPEWHIVATRRTVWILSMASLTTAMFSGVRTVFTLQPFFLSVEPVASKFRTQVLMAWADGTTRLRWILNSLRNSHWAITKLSPFL